MIIKKNKSRVNKLLIALFCILLFSAGLVVPVQEYARADETQYSGVLDDLQSDSAFNASDFDNTSVHPQTELIQIAESTDNQLFIYVHFVGENKPLSKIVFNTQTAFEKLDFQSYELACVSENESFCKYLVNDFTTKSTTHIYAITRLEYPVNKIVSGTQKVTYEYIPVDQYWTVSYVDGNAKYSQEHLTTIEIIDKYLGSYNRGVKDSWGNYTDWTDTFYYAFSTEIDMDKLVEVQIEYQICLSNLSGVSNNQPTSKEPINCVIYADETAEYKELVKDTPWLLSWNFWYIPWKPETVTRRFEKISTPEEFREKSKLDLPKGKDDKEFQWVVTFYNHSYKPNGVVAVFEVPYSASILRLKYVKDGITYNVGTLDTRSTYIPQPIPDENSSVWDKILASLEWILNHWYLFAIAVVVIVAIIIFAPFFPFILSFIVQLFVWLFKGIIWLVTFPFRLIISIFTGGK